MQFIKRYSLFIVAFLFLIENCCAQLSNQEKAQLDSLTSIIKSESSKDTTLAKVYVSISEILYVSNLDTMIPLCNSAKLIAEKNLLRNDLKKGEKLSFQKSLGTAFNNIGYVFQSKGDILRAIEYFSGSLKILEDIKNKSGIADALNNLGAMYDQLNETSYVIDYYTRSLKIREEIGDKKGIGYSLNNLGYIYSKQKEFPKALEYYTRSLNIQIKLADKLAIATCLNNLGKLYFDQNDLIKAAEYYVNSLKLKEEIGDKNGIIYSLNSLGELYIRQNELAKAENLVVRAFKLSNEMGAPQTIRNSARLLNKIYRSTQRYQQALEMNDLYILMKDSIENEQNRKSSIKQQFKYTYDKKVAADSIRIADEKKILDVQFKHEQTQRYALFGGLILVLAFSIFIFKRFKISQKQNIIIEKQKTIVEEKQTEILDSILYAKRIQTALLTSDEYITENLPNDYFILFKPKDIVSGDFYWALKYDNKFYLATCDCTGHGVPGAFMSMLNISLLNEVILERRITEPNEIFNHIREEIIVALNPKGSKEVCKDGMDAVLCCFDFENMKLTFAAANNALWLVRNNELVEFKPDKMPVGKYSERNLPFKLETIDLLKGDVIYTSTDGYPDQFGGLASLNAPDNQTGIKQKGKKLMRKNLKEILLKIHKTKMVAQKEHLNNYFEDWKNGAEQLDDVCIIGVRV